MDVNLLLNTLRKVAARLLHHADSRRSDSNAKPPTPILITVSPTPSDDVVALEEIGAEPPKPQA